MFCNNSYKGFQDLIIAAELSIPDVSENPGYSYAVDVPVEQSEAVIRRCSVKKVFLKIWQNS